jgi:hypothetical protein
LYGGEIEGKEGFDPTLYFDLTIEDEEDIDDDTYKKRFLFWNEIASGLNSTLTIA